MHKLVIGKPSSFKENLFETIWIDCDPLELSFNEIFYVLKANMVTTVGVKREGPFFVAYHSYNYPYAPAGATLVIEVG